MTAAIISDYLKKHPTKETRSEEFEDVVDEIKDELKKVDQRWSNGKSRHFQMNRARYVNLSDSIKAMISELEKP